MTFLLIIFTVFGGAAFLCVVVFAAFNGDEYFHAAFSNERPKIFGSNAANTNQILYYWITRVFLICFIGFILIYLFNLARN